MLLAAFIGAGIGGIKSLSMEEFMFRHVLIIAAITGLSAVALPVEASAAEAGAGGQMTCKDAAKMDFPNDRKGRRAFKKECKAAWKASQG